MSDDDRPEGIDPEEWQRFLATVRPVAIGARVRIRQQGRRRTDEWETRTAKTVEELEAFKRWLPGAANRGGRTDERAQRLAEYRTAILALHEKGYLPAQITGAEVLKRLHRTGSEAQLRKDVSDADIGGWKNFRLAVLRERLSGR